MFDYDGELRRYHVHLMAAADIDSDSQVLDIGCGAGQTTRAAGRAAADGWAVGIDISAPMLQQARRLTDLEGLTNVTYECGDATGHPLPFGRFTAGISRFGTMFFADPAAAFAHIGEALRSGARFTQLVWQRADRQEWLVGIQRALADESALPESAFDGAAFSMADPAKVEALLTTAGFTEVRLTPLRESVCYGADADSALHAVQSLGMTDRALHHLEKTAADRALSRLRTFLEAHDKDGVWLDSNAWVVVARRR